MGVLSRRRRHMERTGFWMRMGQWFRNVSGNADGPDASDASAPLPDGPSAVTEARSGEPGLLRPLARLRNHRGANLERLEQEYSRVVHLIEAVQQHLEHQSERSERMTAS